MKTVVIIAISAGVSVAAVLGISFFSIDVPTIQDVQLEINPKEKCKTLVREYYGILDLYPGYARTETFSPSDEKRIHELMPQIAGGCDGVLSQEESADLLVELGRIEPP